MEHIDLGKSANQLWKESGSTLRFREWLQREKDKGRFLPNKNLSEFNSVDGDLSIEQTNEDIAPLEKPLLKKSDKDSYFDVAKIIVVVSVALVLGGLALHYYKKK